MTKTLRKPVTMLLALCMVFTLLSARAPTTSRPAAAVPLRP